MVDGIGPITGSVFGPLGLDVGDLENSQFGWKTVIKGKRSRKSVGRNSSGLSKLPSDSPVRVVDFAGSDSEKYVETSVWPHSSDESQCVPLKKRRHILWAPSPPPSHASLPNADQLPLQHQPASDDFSGIALLADTACSDSTEEPDKAKKGGDMESPSSILRRCHTIVSSMQPRDSALCSGQKDVLHLDDKKASYADQTGGDDDIIDIPFGAADFGSSEVDTQHEDLYTLMEACKENEASYNWMLKEKRHMNEEYASTDNDGESTLVYTIPKHQMGILNVTGSENSERKNDNQMKEDWPENGINETPNTVVETCGVKSEGVFTSENGNLQESIKTKTNVSDGGSNKLDAYENEDHVQLDSSHNIYKFQNAEWRRSSILPSCMETELEYGGHEVGYNLESSHYPGPEGSKATEKILGVNKELDDIMGNIELELGSSMAVEKHDSGGKRKCPFDIAVSRMEETGSKVISDKWKTCTEGWNTSGRFGKVGVSRSDRENSPDRHATRITRYGSPLLKYRQTEGNRQIGHPGSRHGNHFRPRGKVHRPPRYQIGDCIGRSQENCQPLEGIRQPFSQRRSQRKRFDFHDANTKVTNIRSNRRERSSENGSGGYFREEYDKLFVDGDVERYAQTRRVDRMRGSFQKPKMSASYEEDFVPSPKGQFQHASRGKRFVRETVFLTHPTKHQKPPPRDVFRQDQKLTDTRNLSRRFPTVSSRDELYEHSNNGRKTNGMRYPDKRRSRFEDGPCVDGKKDCYRKGQRNFAGDYGESPLSPTSNRSRWANESNLVSGPSSRYTRSPMRGGGEFRRTERPVGLSGQRKSSDYSTTRNTTRYVE